MKLQINTKGSWRDMLTYGRCDDVQVRAHGSQLARRASGTATLRVLDDDGSVVAYWDVGQGWINHIRRGALE